MKEACSWVQYLRAEHPFMLDKTDERQVSPTMESTSTTAQSSSPKTLVILSTRLDTQALGERSLSWPHSMGVIILPCDGCIMVLRLAIQNGEPNIRPLSLEYKLLKKTSTSTSNTVKHALEYKGIDMLTIHHGTLQVEKVITSAVSVANLLHSPCFATQRYSDT